MTTVDVLTKETERNQSYSSLVVRCESCLGSLNVEAVRINRILDVATSKYNNAPLMTDFSLQCRQFVTTSYTDDDGYCNVVLIVVSSSVTMESNWRSLE